MAHDARVDGYIAEAAPFARPILTHLRALIHAACPGATETIKWGRPFFMLDGRPLVYMAAFKAHAALGFWHGTETGREADAAGQYGRLLSRADLPPDDVLTELVRRSAAPVPAGGARPPRRPPPEVPPDLAAQLAADPAARACFDRLAPSHQREYVTWITAAKRAETRARRVERTVARLAAGLTIDAKEPAMPEEE